MSAALSGPGALSPDAHVGVPDASGRDLQCALWWRDTPRITGRRVGFIGHWPVNAGDVGARLLSRARRRLAQAGCGYVVGPIDGSTWHTYRLALGGPSAPMFPLEPPRLDPTPFEAAGFAPCGRYRTTVVPLPAHPRGTSMGRVRIRPLDPDRMESELAVLHALANTAFREAFLFRPIPRARFDALYGPRLAHVDPGCVRIAERDGEAAGFLFAFPGGEDAVVLKSLAVHPAWRRRGIGRALMQDAASRAAAEGRTRALHALTHDRNVSRRFAGMSAPILRRYVLFGASAASRSQALSARSVGCGAIGGFEGLPPD